MVESHGHQQVAVLIDTIKQLLRARGMRYRDIAAAIGVTERTVKRWFVGKGLTLQVVEDLCNVLGMTIIELCEVAKDDLDSRPQRLSREQERSLFADLQLALVFLLISRGWSPQEVQRECRMPEALLVGHLVRLEKLKLVELLPGNKVRVLFGRNIRWGANGEAGRAFGRGLRNLFTTMDYSRPEAVWSAQVVNLSPRSLDQVNAKFHALSLEIQQAADADRRSPESDRTWHAVFMAAHAFDPLALERGAE